MNRYFACPHCEELLPINMRTECSECGAHLELLVRTIAGPQPTKDEVEDNE